MALNREELATLIIFQRIAHTSWVREVHRFESMRKRKQNFVIFRDSNNRKLTSLAELKAKGVEVDESSFKAAVCNEIVSNRVGANKKARREARAWTHELMGGEKPEVEEKVSKTVPEVAAPVEEAALPAGASHICLGLRVQLNGKMVEPANCWGHGERESRKNQIKKLSTSPLESLDDLLKVLIKKGPVSV